MLKYFYTAPKDNGLTLILPGLPAEVTKQCEDIALAFAEVKERSVAVMHYPGIGINSREKFLYSNSLLQTSETITRLKAEYEKIWVVGHSWGGFNALLNLVSLSSHAERVICASPYLGYYDLKNAKALLEYFISSYPHIFQRERIEELQNDFYENKMHTGLIGHRINTEVLKRPLIIFQALQDDTTPASIARECFVDLPNCDYIEIDDDHGFSQKRKEFIDRLVTTLK